ncbi:MAG: hypothetical protein R2734_01255 [Nocardioides sp.]
MIDQGAIKGPDAASPATYTGLLEPIRKAFAKENGVKPALFSANSEGACPACNGAGVVFTDLGVMATVESTCEECEGRRFQAAVLEQAVARGLDVGRHIVERAGHATAHQRARRSATGLRGATVPRRASDGLDWSRRRSRRSRS